MPQWKRDEVRVLEGFSAPRADRIERTTIHLDREASERHLAMGVGVGGFWDEMHREALERHLSPGVRVGGFWVEEHAPVIGYADREASERHLSPGVRVGGLWAGEDGVRIVRLRNCRPAFAWEAYGLGRTAWRLGMRIVR